MDQFLTYQGVSFNATNAAGKKLSEFADHEKHHGFTREQFKELHDACKALVKAPIEQEANQLKTPAGE